MIYSKETTENNIPFLRGYIQLVERTLRHKMVKILGEHVEIEKTTELARQVMEYYEDKEEVVMRGKIMHAGQRTDLLHRTAENPLKKTRYVPKKISTMNSTRKLLTIMVKDIVKGKDEHYMLSKYEYKYIRYKILVNQTANEVIATELFNHRLKNNTLRPWQMDVLDRLEAQNDKQILFCVDEPGRSSGKTWFAEYLHLRNNAFHFPSSNYHNTFEAYKNERHAVFDLSKEDLLNIDYGTLEALKEGMAFRGHQHITCKLFPSVKVVVLLNGFPDMTKLPYDKYDVYVINTE